LRSERVLLIVGPGVESLSGSLRGILQPHFELDVLALETFVEESQRVKSGSVLDAFSNRSPALIFVVLPANRVATAGTLIQSIKAAGPAPPIIIILEAGEPTDILNLLDLGVADFITSPLTASEVLSRTWTLTRRFKSETRPRPEVRTEVKRLIGESPVFLAEINKILMVAKCDANVLIAGETGTGKEVYSRAIHYNSARRDKPFVPVNCGAIPVELVENELFGHERGAFTSAATIQVGLIEEANGGTLFLDEIDCLPVYAQVKLLRFLQDKEYRPLGSAKTRRANARVIAASNVDLNEAVEQGRMRRDLFYRLNTISLTLPPLRERREDIPLLAQHFLEKYSTGFGKSVKEISPEALCLLMVHPWPGNVRELEHIIEKALILCDGPILNAHDVGGFSLAPEFGRESLQQTKAKEIARFEKNYVQGLLCACRGNITRAAQVAQKNRRAFWQLIQKHQIDVEKIKANTIQTP
jgi:two-component system, NtrC family, response regulator GlrR